MNRSSQPIRVLHLLGKLGSGGVEKLLVSLMENIDREVVSFDFLLWNKNEKGFYDDYVQNLGARLVYLNLDDYKNKIKRVILKCIKFYSFLKNNKYLILHLHGTQPMQYVYAFLAKKAGIKTVIIHAHNTQSLTGLRTKVLPLFKFFFKSYPSYYLACSQEAAEYMWPKGVKEDESCVLINGINFEIYSFKNDERQKFRLKYGLNDKYVVGHIGRFVSQKNHSFLIEVFYHVQKKIPNSILLLIGEGVMKTQIRNRARVLGIDNKVIFFGITKDISSALMGMDVMCFPSVYEGLGIVAVEAQAASLPIVVSDGVPESANISKYYHKLNLRDSVEKWADLVCSFQHGVEREENSDYPQHSDYNIKETADKLVKIYKRFETEEL